MNEGDRCPNEWEVFAKPDDIFGEMVRCAGTLVWRELDPALLILQCPACEWPIVTMAVAVSAFDSAARLAVS